MDKPEITEDKFFACCFTLAVEDIYELNKADNGPLNNVIVNLEDHCYGVELLDDEHGFDVRMFFVDNRQGLRGDIIILNLMDEDYNLLLMTFCNLLAESYENVDVIAAVNTYQTKLRGFLEKSGFFTVSNHEIEPYLGQGAVMFSNAKRGIFKMKFIKHRDYYRDWFGNIHDGEIVENAEYVYLMVNEETGLIKIGRSKNPKYREGTLHSKEPTVHRVAFWKADKELEKLLHDRYAKSRIRGEWFRLTFKQLNDLERFVQEYLQSNVKN